MCTGTAGASRYHQGVPRPALYDVTPPLRSHHLPVGGGHELLVQEFGRADGIPALVLHGGPGSGCSPLLRRFFDPARYRVICVDQRGAGGSRPHGSIVANTTPHLLGDLRHVRERLGLARWLVVGGSWGATLAVAHAADAPDAVAALLLRASFLARREDIEWFFQGVCVQWPEARERMAESATRGRRDALLPWLAKALMALDAATREHAALTWWRWEQAMATGSVPAVEPAGDALAALVGRYRVQSHYMLHDCWLTAPTLLERCADVPRVPTLLLHARDDRICRAEGAVALQRNLPWSRLEWIDGAGHDPAHPAMAGAMVAALDRYATHADFGAGS
jgi:proline iminopeptidase